MNSASFFQNKIVRADFGAALLALLFFLADCLQKQTVDLAFLLPVALSWGFLLILYLFCRRSALQDERLSDEAQRMQASLTAHKLKNASDTEHVLDIAAEMLRKGDLFLVRAGEQFPADGEIISGTASVDESAITGESSPVLREADSDRRFVTCGTVLLSEQLVVRATKNSAGTPAPDVGRALLLSELSSEGRNVKNKFLPGICFLILVLAAFLLTAAQLDGIHLSVLEMLICIPLILVGLTPLASSAFLEAVDRCGMDRLFWLRMLPKEGRVLPLIGQMKTLFAAKGLVFSARTNGEALPQLHTDKLRDAFEGIRQMGVDVVLITGDPAVRAAELAAEAGAAHFLSDADLPAQIEAIRTAQKRGEICGMLGASLSDSPALAQADVAISMNNGSAEAREAANLIDLDSHPEKICELIRIGKKTRLCKRRLLRTATVCEFLKLAGLLFFLLHASLFGLTMMFIISLVQAFLLYWLLERAF